MNQAVIRRRHVFYLPGFDPRGAGHYHRLYKRESARQGALTGIAYDVGGREKISHYLHRWHVTAADHHGRRVETVYDFLAWDDIIRAEWPRGFKGALQSYFAFAARYLLTGGIFKYTRTKKAALAGFYPVVFGLLVFVAGGLLGDWAYALLRPFLPSAAAFAVAAATGVFLVRYGFRLGERLAVFWLLRIYVFCARWVSGQIEGIDARMALFAKEISNAIDDPSNDEIVVVGHSVGAVMAVPVLARVLETAQKGMSGLTPARLKLLTIGSCIPLVSYNPKADAYRRDLFAVAHDARVEWVDYTAKGDGACFYLHHPVEASGMTQQPGLGPVLRSARFFTLYTAGNYRKMRRDFYRMHFLYLAAGDMIGQYDYFAMTAGVFPLSVREGMTKESTTS